MDWSLDKVGDALEFLDSGHTEVWLRAGMAIKKAFGDEGFTLWDNWSAKDARYNKREVKARWKSFKGHSTRGSVSLGSVIYWAMAHGYRPQDNQGNTNPEQTRAALHRQQQLAQQWAQEEADIKRWHQVIAEFSQQLISHLRPVGVSPYLGKKRVGAYGVYFVPRPLVFEYLPDFTVRLFSGAAVMNFFKHRTDETSFVYCPRGTLIIPLKNNVGELRNVQLIYGDGKTKRFLSHGQKSGLFHVIGQRYLTPENPLIFCEGYATGASIHQAAGWPVVVCFDAGNLPLVAAQFREHPNQKICAGDNDGGERNTGKIKAQEAATACGGVWCVPHFASNHEGLTDFNDLHQHEGVQAVKAQLHEARRSRDNE